MPEPSNSDQNQATETPKQKTLTVSVAVETPDNETLNKTPISSSSSAEIPSELAPAKVLEMKNDDDKQSKMKPDEFLPISQTNSENKFEIPITSSLEAVLQTNKPEIITTELKPVEKIKHPPGNILVVNLQAMHVSYEGTGSIIIHDFKQVPLKEALSKATSFYKYRNIEIQSVPKHTYQTKEDSWSLELEYAPQVIDTALNAEQAKKYLEDEAKKFEAAQQKEKESLKPLPEVCFIASHGGSAEHFATFVEELSESKNKPFNLKVFASGQALKKFQERKITVSDFSLDKLSGEEEDFVANVLAFNCAKASVVITDVGHAFDVKVQKSLSKYPIKRLAYYDNPESYVPGGYSTVAANVMKAAQGVLFANSNLAAIPIYHAPKKEVNLSAQEKIGIGYYPFAQAEKITQRRAAEHDKMHSEFLFKLGINDSTKKIIVVYFGANNDEYFNLAFKEFLKFLSKAKSQYDLKNIVFLIHQHPAAKEKNLDGIMFKQWIKDGSLDGVKIVLSEYSSDDAQVLADAALYYQTSMVPQFLLAGIPTMQVAHEVNEDILVKNQLGLSISANDPATVFDSFVKGTAMEPDKKLILQALGVKDDWLQELKKVLIAQKV